jgi:hypothetical protein
MEAPGQPEADSLVSDWASMLECSAERETVLAGVGNLAEELNQARKRGRRRSKAAGSNPETSHGRSPRPRGWSGHCLACRSSGVEATADAATVKSVALLCQTRRHRKETAELNDRITQLNEDVERGRLGQGILRGEVAARRRARERAEERLEAMAHDIEALRDSSHGVRLPVDSRRGCRGLGSGWLTSSGSWTAGRRNWRIGRRS